MVHNQEENPLEKWKEAFDSIPVPEKLLDDAIFTGIAKAKKKKRRMPYKWLVLASAVFILVFVTSIRTSSVFADALTTIPGMEKIITLINGDKGLLETLKQNYAQKGGMSDAHNGVKVKVDGIIANKNEIHVYYTISSTGNKKFINIRNADIKTKKGKSLNAAYAFDANPYDINKKSYSRETSFIFETPIKEREYNLELFLEERDRLNSKVKRKVIKQAFSIPIKLSEESFHAKNKKYKINKTVLVQKQKITIKDAEVTPLRTAIRFQYDPHNTKQLFNIQGLSLIDEKGEKYSPAKNGITGTIPGINERIVYMESIYFNKSKEYYLTFSKTSAIDKKDIEVIIDPLKKKVLKKPADNLITGIEITKNAIEFHYKGSGMNNLSFSRILNSKGKEILIDKTSYFGGEGNYATGIHYDPEKLPKGPVTFIIDQYPGEIAGAVKLKIK